MNSTHVHLVITHLPIFGTLSGLLVLAYGLWKKSDQTINASYLVFIASAIGGAISYFTGESAEDTAENIPGIAKDLIDQHEDFAFVALVSVLILGGLALIGLLTTKFKSIAKGLSWIILIVAGVTFFLVARTGYLGGQIRHTEVTGNTGINPSDQEEKTE